MNYLKYIGLAFLLISTHSFADEDAAVQKISEGLKKLVPNMEITKIEPSVVPGFYQVIVGPEALFVSEDGRFIFNGDLYDVDSKENMTETVKSEIRRNILSELTEEDYIEFSPQNPKHILYVFTDLSCGYCRKLHSHMEDMNSLGIAVRYLAYPRSGPGSPAADDLAAVWCAEDRKTAMNEAQAGNPQPYELCMSPVNKHYEMGAQMGIHGTPASFLPNGKALPGYLPPNKLIKRLEELG